VNQNLPPNPPGQSGDYSSDDRQGYDPNAQGSNPYYSAQQSSQGQPDLDSGAPQLKAVDSQRVNRKALMFIAGILALLVLMTLIVIKNASSDKEDAVKKPREEKVVIPDLPKGTNVTGGPDFAELQEEPQPVPVQELPPLPQEQPLPEQDRRSQRDDFDAESQGPRGPTLAERRMGAEVGSSGAGGQASTTPPFVQALLDQQAAAAAGGGSGGAAPARETRTKVSMAQYQRNPDALMVRGTYIRCILETRIITDINGYTSCVVTEPVYSINGRKLLLPKGSKALGRYQGEPTGPRVEVIWDRITTPNGLDVTLESAGVDNLGGAGHPGDYNGHWVSKMSSAIFISLISDAFKYAAAKNGPPTDNVTSGGTIVSQPFESNTASTVERLANQALAKAASRPATVTINQGTVVNIYVVQDVDFSGVIARR
jgi:type IV secretion system protein VirB10